MAEDLIALRGHHVTKSLVKPTLGNLVLWRSVYIHQERIYVDAIRVGMFANNKIFEGESVEKLSIEKHLPLLDKASVLYNDIQRFTLFSDNYVAIDPTKHNVIGDIRYSMLPTSRKPLWGIVINEDAPQVHADYQFFRDSSKQVREKFIEMLMLNEK